MNKKIFFLVCFSIIIALVDGSKRQDAEIQALKKAPYQEAVPFATISDPAITEASGLVLSSINKNIFWTINDGGNSAVLYGISPKNNTVYQFDIKNAINRDWEDLSSFRIKSTQYLIIADVGDNYAQRQHYTLYFIKEHRITKQTQTKGNVSPP